MTTSGTDMVERVNDIARAPKLDELAAWVAERKATPTIIAVTEDMVERHSRFIDPLFWKVIEEFPGAGAEQLRGTCLVKSRAALVATLTQTRSEGK